MINPSNGIVDWHVDLFYDGQWHEITDDVQVTDNLQITRGRSDYESEIPPTSASFVLDNTEGKYSPKNPMSPLYGKIGRNQPVRIRVGEPRPLCWFSDDAAFVTDDTSGEFSPQDSNLILEFEIEPATWRPREAQVFLAKGDSRPWDDLSWYVVVTPSGQIRFCWFSFSEYHVWQFPGPVVPEDVTSRAFRLEWSPDGFPAEPESVGHPAVKFEWAPSWGDPWQGYDGNYEWVPEVPTTNLDAPSTGLSIGAAADARGITGFAETYRGAVTHVRVSTPSGVLSDVTLSEDGAIDAVGRQWVATGSVIVIDKSARFTGDVQAWPPRWGQPDGSDAHTPIEAFGVRRRLEHTSEEAKSPFRRASDNEGLAARNLAYWPMEDASGAMAFASEVGDYEMVFGNIPGYHIRDIELAQDSSFYASKPLPRFNVTAAVGRVRPSEPTGEYRLYALVKLPEGGVPKADDDTDNIVDLLTLQMAGTISEWVIQVNSSGYMRFKRVLASTGAIGYTGWTAAPSVWESEHSGFNGLNLLTGIWVRQNGAHVDYQVFFRAMGRSQTFAPDYVRSFADLGYPTAVSVGAVGDLGGTVVGHVTLRNRDTDDGDTLWTLVYDALNGNTPETATERVDRLVDEEGLPVIVAPGPLTSEAVGVQKTATVLDILEDTTSSDLATLIDDRASHAMRYLPRSALYNQRPVVLDYAAGHIIEPFEPTDDDADIVNDVTVTREDGGSFRAVEREGPLSTEAPPDGIGRYEASHTFNLASDAQLANQAGWRLHLGTVDEVRYPRVSVSLNGSPELIDTLLPVDVGDRVQIENLPKWLPPNMADVIVQGYTEESDGLQWTVSLNCTPASPWSVGVADDPVYGRADTAGSELVYAVDDTAQVLPVLTTEGPRWVQASDVGGQFPFEATVGGEIVTVTSVIPLLSDDFVRGDAGVWDDPVRGLWDNTFIWSA